MARPRQYKTAAEKQRAYRRKKMLRALPERDRAWIEAVGVNAELQIKAAAGDPVAARLYAGEVYETAIRLLAYLGSDALRCAHWKAIQAMSTREKRALDLD